MHLGHAFHFFRHKAYAGGGYSHSYGASHGFHHLGWIGHSIISAIIHGLIYSFIFKLMRHMDLQQALVLVVLVIGVVVLGYMLLARNKG